MSVWTPVERGAQPRRLVRVGYGEQAVHLGLVRVDFLLHEAPNRRDDQFLFFGQSKLHRRTPSFERVPSLSDWTVQS